MPGEKANTHGLQADCFYAVVYIDQRRITSEHPTSRLDHHYVLHVGPFSHSATRNIH